MKTQHQGHYDPASVQAMVWPGTFFVILLGDDGGDDEDRLKLARQIAGPYAVIVSSGPAQDVGGQDDLFGRRLTREELILSRSRFLVA